MDLGSELSPVLPGDFAEFLKVDHSGANRVMASDSSKVRQSWTLPSVMTTHRCFRMMVAYPQLRGFINCEAWVAT